MKLLNVTRDLIPLSEFKTHVSKILNEMRRNKRPVVITQNGKAAGVLVHPEEYDRMQEREEFLAAVADGIENARDGSIITDKELDRRLEKTFGKAKT